MRRIQMLDLKRQYEYMKTDIDSAIAGCLEHQQWILGPEVKGLEDAVGGYLGVRHSVGVSSGTEALVLSLRALAIKLRGEEYFDRGDEIITTPLSFTATGDAILRAGATSVFVDIDPETYNIDVNKIRDYLASASGARTVGIIPVHLYGKSCRMDEIMAAAGQYGLFVVEDVAQAFGGAYDGRRLGSAGVAGAFSFFPSKNLGCFGDGGMVSTNDDTVAELVRMLLRHGGRDKYRAEHIGYNARLDTMQAAILLAKFKYIDEFNGRRRRLAETYTEGLADVGGLALPAPGRASEHVYHQYTIRVLGGRRDALKRHLDDRGVSSMVYYPVPLHKMEVFRGRSRIAGDLGNSERAVSEILSIPMEPLQTEEETLHVVSAIKESLRLC